MTQNWLSEVVQKVSSFLIYDYTVFIGYPTDKVLGLDLLYIQCYIEIKKMGLWLKI